MRPRTKRSVLRHEASWVRTFSTLRRKDPLTDLCKLGRAFFGLKLQHLVPTTCHRKVPFSILSQGLRLLVGGGLTNSLARVFLIYLHVACFFKFCPIATEIVLFFKLFFSIFLVFWRVIICSRASDYLIDLRGHGKALVFLVSFSR